MIEKPGIKKALLQALYVIVVCYIVFNMLGAIIFIRSEDAWILVSLWLLFKSAILNFITALVTKRFNRIIPKIHKIMAVVCIVSLVVVMIIG